MKIDFEFDTKYGTFRDALYLSDDLSYSDDEIENIKQERLKNWIDLIEKVNNQEVLVTGNITNAGVI